jgi:hypothetical protein
MTSLISEINIPGMINFGEAAAISSYPKTKDGKTSLSYSGVKKRIETVLTVFLHKRN